MSIDFSATGERRKALVTAISEILGLEAVYNGAPTFAYTLGGCMVDRNGVLSFSEGVTDRAISLLVTELEQRGFRGEAPARDVPDDNTQVVIEVRRTDFADEALDNLRKIIASKDTLIKKALGLHDLPFSDNALAVEVTEDKLRFPWFAPTCTDDEADAYARFVCALCSMAEKQNRVTAREREVENDKFTMRLFLVRLGLKGPENKAVRQIMLRNLSGNSSWKDGQPPARG